MPDRFMGIPVEDLDIDTVDWTYRGDYIRKRSRRKQRPREFDVEPEWATEAALDSQGIRGVASQGSVGVIGWSQSAGRVLVVVLVPKDFDPTSGAWWGATAWAASPDDTARYERR